MTDTLVVVFTLNDDPTERYLKPLGLTAFAKDGKNVALIAEGYCTVETDHVGTTGIDIILLRDNKQLDTQQCQILAILAGLKKYIHIAYHRYKKKQQQTLQEIFGEKLVSSLDEHHDSGNVYDLLIQLAGCNGNAECYQTVLSRLISLFAGNPDLDARLELLDLCLTPEGAALVINNQPPNHIPSRVCEKIQKLLEFQHDGQTVRDMIQGLNHSGADPLDDSEGGYIDKLAAIRRVLEGSATPVESTEPPVES